VGNMRTVLHQIWATLYVEYVVKSPLAPTEHPRGMGVANELFEGGLESFMVSSEFCKARNSANTCSGFHIFSASMITPKSEGTSVRLEHTTNMTRRSNCRTL
jgi:hypothetical protein